VSGFSRRVLQSDGLLTMRISLVLVFTQPVIDLTGGLLRVVP
jgi:hypothetical protein